MNDAAGQSTRRWWLPRFGLRTFFVLVTVLGVGLGYLGIVQQRVQRQRRIVKAIEKIGGKVFYHHEIPPWDKEFDVLSWGATISSEKTEDGRKIMTRTHGGVTTVFVESPPGPWIVRRLLGDDAFAYVYRADLKWMSNAPGRTDFDPRLLTQLSQLQSVWLADAQVCDEWLEVVGRIPDLRILDLSGFKQGTATAAGLRHLSAADHLSRLSLNGEWVEDGTLDSIGELRALASLELYTVPRITGEVFNRVGQLHQLRNLVIVRAKGVDDRKSENLRKLKMLRKFWLYDTSITDETIAHLAALPELELIDVTISGVGDKGMEVISGLTNLTSLQLTRTQVGDGGLKSISRLNGLQYLSLGETRVTDAGMEDVGRLTELEQLRMFGLNVTDEGILKLKVLTKLTKLDIGPHISKKAADELREALPGCKISRFNKQGSASSPDYEDEPEPKESEM